MQTTLQTRSRLLTLLIALAIAFGSAGRVEAKLAAQAAAAIKREVAGLKEGWKNAHGKLDAAPSLGQPVLLVPGLFLSSDLYRKMGQHLSAGGKNGRVVAYTAADGKFHDTKSTGPVLSDKEASRQKIFTIQYSNRNAHSQYKTAELEAAIEKIRALTSSDKVDVVTHSQGASDVRRYVKLRAMAKKPVSVGRAIFIDPMTNGTYWGNFGARFGNRLGMQKAAGGLAIGSEHVRWLNADWPTQLEQLESVTTMAITGAPTFDRIGLGSGDGFTTPRDVALSGAKNLVIRGVNPTPFAHGFELVYPAVISAVGHELHREPATRSN